MAWKQTTQKLKLLRQRYAAGIADEIRDTPDIWANVDFDFVVNISMFDGNGEFARMAITPDQADELAALLTEAAAIARAANEEK